MEKIFAAEDRTIHVRETIRSQTSLCGRVVGHAADWQDGNVWVLPEQFDTVPFAGTKCAICKERMP